VLVIWLSALFVLPASAGSWGKPDANAWADEPAATVSDKNLSVDEPIVMGDLAVYPVLDRSRTGWSASRTTHLSDAMADGTVRVGESGDVDSLVMINEGDRPVSVTAGDLVGGGHQDRLITRDVVLPPGRPVAVNVQCIERGRWSGVTEGFVYAGRADAQLLRAARAGQEHVWAAVAQRNAREGRDGSSSFIAGLDSGQRAQLRALERELATRTDGKRLVGLVVARSGQLVDREVHPDAATFAAHRTDVLAAHVRAASGPVWAVPVPSTGDALAFLDD
jgi:hypothetical protein